VAVVPMAHEYRPWEAASARPAALAALGDQDFVLCVGTLSARKNQVGLVRAWQRYRAATRRARPAHLVLAGAPGAGSSEVLALLDATDHCGGTVHVLPQTTDAELNWLYQNCLFTAYVSFAEGFGLPIGESLWLGKVCLASSTTSMPEVGGDLAVYIDPHCVDQIAEGLRRLLEEPETLHTLTGRISRDALRTWRDFQNDLALAIRLHFSR
jgi:glycosyltransferase involved in cell wall biosynthesis